MDFNLADLVTDYLSTSLINKLSRAIDSDSTLTQSALNGAIPLLLGSLQTQSSKPHGAETIFTVVSKQNGGILKSFDEILSTNNHDQLASTGNNILTTAVGQTEKDAITGNIADFSGLNKGAASTLLGLITPVTLSLVKLKLLDSGEFNSVSLTSMLQEQQDNIKSALPSELTAFYALNSDKNKSINENTPINPGTKTNIESTSTAQDNTRQHSENPSENNPMKNNSMNNGQNNELAHEPIPNQYTANSSFWLTKVLPLLLFTGVLYLAFNIMFKNDKSSEIIEPVADAASTSLTRIQKPLSRNRSSTYQTNINQHMQPTSKSTTPEVTAAGNSSISNVASIAQIEIAQNLQSELDNSLSQAANTLGKIVDIPSAKLAATDIRKVTARIDELTELSKTMPDTVKKRLEELITSNLPRLQALTKNANDIPNVGEVIKSPIQALAASLTNFL